METVTWVPGIGNTPYRPSWSRTDVGSVVTRTHEPVIVTVLEGRGTCDTDYGRRTLECVGHLPPVRISIRVKCLLC